MIRNRQVSYPETQDFNNQRLDNIYSVRINGSSGTPAAGEIKRDIDGKIVYRHPTAGTVIIVDEDGNVGNVSESDKFLQVTMTATTSITIIHSFGRPAQVRVFEGDSESDCSIIYPPGEETTKVVVESNVPITATIFLN
jgi:hypothetical protein